MSQLIGVTLHTNAKGAGVVQYDWMNKIWVNASSDKHISIDIEKTNVGHDTLVHYIRPNIIEVSFGDFTMSILEWRILGEPIILTNGEIEKAKIIIRNARAFDKRDSHAY